LTITALVLRNYGCAESELAAECLALALHGPRYGSIHVDPNNPDEFPDGKDENGVDRWYPYVQSRIAEVDYVIFMLSKALNDAVPNGPRGIGVLSEALSFWSAPDPKKERKLIFVTIDCSLADLRQPNGRFEQLQDIIVPLARRVGVIAVESASLTRFTPVPREVSDAVATRMGIQPSNVPA
jgi:hypothetical protein